MAHFGPIFPILRAKKFFPKTPALSCTTSHGLLAPCQNLEKINDTIKRFIGHKTIKTNIFRIQSNTSIMCGYFWIRFIDSMLADETLIDYTSLFSPYDFENNGNIILGYFKNE